MRKAVSLVLGAMLAVALSQAGAYFTGQVSVADNVIRAGTVSVSAEPTSAALSMDAVAPGVIQARDLVVRNTGSLPSDLVVTGAKKMGITDFYNSLECKVVAGSEVLYEGPMNALRTLPVRLDAGQQATLRFFVSLPAEADNALADDYVRMTLYVDAEQAH